MSSTVLKVALVLLLVAILRPLGALAVQPDEILADPDLEARARSISANLRCLVCQNQSIDDSDAELARDLRILVRERLSAGESDVEVVDFVVARYGEFVLLRPRFSWGNALLWMTPALLLVLGGGVIVARARRSPQPAPVLAEDEKRRLRDILREPE
jgi:cytochrome c-type biogenesis protein CcmH